MTCAQDSLDPPPSPCTDVIDTGEHRCLIPERREQHTTSSIHLDASMAWVLRGSSRPEVRVTDYLDINHEYLSG